MYFSPYVIAAALVAIPSRVNGFVAHQEPRSVVTGTYGNSTVWITQTVTAYQTYCPASTKFKHGNNTYTATAQTWVTVTDCPNLCTISNQAGSKPTVVPIGEIPRWNNVTFQPTPVSCPCSEANITQPATGNSCPCYSSSAPITGSTTESANSNSNTPLTTNTGEKITVSLAGLAIVTLGFFAL